MCEGLRETACKSNCHQKSKQKARQTDMCPLTKSPEKLQEERELLAAQQMKTDITRVFPKM